MIIKHSFDVLDSLCGHTKLSRQKYLYESITRRTEQNFLAELKDSRLNVQQESYGCWCLNPKLALAVTHHLPNEVRNFCFRCFREYAKQHFICSCVFLVAISSHIFTYWFKGVITYWKKNLFCLPNLMSFCENMWNLF